MNKKIEDLFEECTAVCENSTGEWDSYLDKERFVELLLTEVIRVLITREGNEKTTDAIWDLEEFGVDVSKILDTFRDH